MNHVAEQSNWLCPAETGWIQWRAASPNIASPWSLRTYWSTQRNSSDQTLSLLVFFIISPALWNSMISHRRWSLTGKFGQNFVLINLQFTFVTVEMCHAATYDCCLGKVHFHTCAFRLPHIYKKLVVSLFQTLTCIFCFCFSSWYLLLHFADLVLLYRYAKKSQ